MCSLAAHMQLACGSSLRVSRMPVGCAKGHKIGLRPLLPQGGLPLAPLGRQHAAGCMPRAGASLQFSASSAAAAAASPAPPEHTVLEQQPQRQPLLPHWALRLAQLASAAAAFAAWYSLASALGSPFASLGLAAAAPPAAEGACGVCWLTAAPHACLRCATKLHATVMLQSEPAACRYVLHPGRP